MCIFPPLILLKIQNNAESNRRQPQAKTVHVQSLEKTVNLPSLGIDVHVEVSRGSWETRNGLNIGCQGIAMNELVDFAQ